MDSVVLAEIADLGVAGFIAAMWLVERRAAVTRERQLSESHDVLINRDRSVDALVHVVSENTQVMGRVVATQREIACSIREFGRRGSHSRSRRDES